MEARLGILRSTGEYIIVHDIRDGKCSIEDGLGYLSLEMIDNVMIVPILKGINTKDKPMSEQDIKIAKQRLDKINRV